MILKNPNAHLFEFCPRCGKKSLAAAGEKSFLCPNCGFKFYINTAAAGIALIFNPNNDLLVTERKHDPAKGMLDLPGGFAEPGETLETCLIREVKEELNLTVLSLDYFCSAPNVYIYKDVTYSITDFAFLCHVNDFDTITAGDDVAGFYFIPPARLDTALFGLASPKTVIALLKEKNISKFHP